MEFLGYLLILAMVYFIASKIYEGYRETGDGRRHCMTCGIDGAPKRETRGSFAIEVILWLCFLVPGLIYSIWRISTRFDSCAACGSKQLVPVNAPAAVAQKESAAQRRCPDCAELIQAQARVCKHCGLKLTAPTEAAG